MAEKEKKVQGKYNDLFASMKLKSLPLPEKIYEIKSTSTVTETCEMLSKHNILSAPVRNQDKKDAKDWSDKYIGIVSMLDVLLYALKSAEDAEQYFKKDLGDKGAFLPLIQSARKFAITPVSAILDDDRTPFMPISTDSSLLEAMWLMNKNNHVYRLIVVDPEEPKVVNILTQSHLVKLLHDNLEKLGDIANKTIEELGLHKEKKLVSVRLTDSALDAFRLIRKHNISAVPVIGIDGLIVGNISVKDARVVVSEKNPSAFQRILSPIKDFLVDIVKAKLDIVPSAIICRINDTLATVIKKLVENKIHRVWIVNDGLKPIGVVSLTDVIDAFVGNPPQE